MSHRSVGQPGKEIRHHPSGIEATRSLEVNHAVPPSQECLGPCVALVVDRQRCGGSSRARSEPILESLSGSSRDLNERRVRGERPNLLAHVGWLQVGPAHQDDVGLLNLLSEEVGDILVSVVRLHLSHPPRVYHDGEWRDLQSILDLGQRGKHGGNEVRTASDGLGDRYGGPPGLCGDECRHEVVVATAKAPPP